MLLGNMLMQQGLITIILFIYFLDYASASLFNSFNGYSPQKKLFVQSMKTYAKFKINLIEAKIKSGDVSPRERELLEEELLSDNGKEGDKSNPQEQLGKLAFIYSVMNRADLNAALTINRVCHAENFLKPSKNPNLCGTYSDFLVKLIELRIDVVISEILFSKGVLGIPKNWMSHVQAVTRDLDTAGLLSLSLRHTLALLLGAAVDSKEIDTALLLPNVLGPKSVSPQVESSASDDAKISAKSEINREAPMQIPQKITIDARSIRASNVLNKAESTLNQIIPNMIMF